MEERSIGSAGKLAAIALILFGISFALLAKESLTTQQGLDQCVDWCKQNRTGNQLTQCKYNCEVYWMCNGSDSTKETCALAQGSIVDAPAPVVPVKPVVPPVAPVVKPAK